MVWTHFLYKLTTGLFKYLFSNDASCRSSSTSPRFQRSFPKLSVTQSVTQSVTCYLQSHRQRRRQTQANAAVASETSETLMAQRNRAAPLLSLNKLYFAQVHWIVCVWLSCYCDKGDVHMTDQPAKLCLSPSWQIKTLAVPCRCVALQQNNLPWLKVCSSCHFLTHGREGWE